MLSDINQTNIILFHLQEIEKTTNTKKGTGFHIEKVNRLLLEGMQVWNV